MTGDVTTGHRSRTAIGRVVCAALLAAVLGTAAVPLRASDLLDRVIAVVSGTVLTLTDAKTAIRFGFVANIGKDDDPVFVAMQWLVDRQLVLDEVNRYEFGDPTAEQVDGEVAAVMQRAGGPGATGSAALASLGLTADSARRFVLDTMRMKLFLERRFESVQPGTEDELRTLYRANVQKFSKDGKSRTFDEARADVEKVFEEIRRVQAIDAYLARLHRRAEVNELYVPIR